MTTFLGKLGEGTAKASSTTIVLTANQAIPAGTNIVVALTHKNNASTTAPTVTVPTIGGVTPFARGNFSQGVTTTASTGIWLRWWNFRTTSAIASGATFTFTLSAAVTARSIVMAGWSSALTTMNPTTGASTTANGSATGAASSITGGTAPSPPAIVVGIAGSETTNLITGDADTTNGSWTPIAGAQTSGGADNTNTSTAIQFKDITAAGVQTFNPTGANDMLTSVLSFVGDVAPAAAGPEPFVGFGIPL